MELKITVALSTEGESAERRLGELNFQEKSEGGHASLAVPESAIQLPDNSMLTVTACYSPSNDGTSVLVLRNGKQVALMLCPWTKANPYLGVQIESVGFLHLYCERLNNGVHSDEDSGSKGFPE